ncbi:hypothetical protein [Rhizobium sp.]|uniref:hypothetical protein n=1 Tax=Rhizobium sp. TaxID=391 RepID=UPI002EDC6583
MQEVSAAVTRSYATDKPGILPLHHVGDGELRRIAYHRTYASNPVDFEAKAPEAGGMIANRATMMHLLTISPLAGRVGAALR